MKVLTNPEIQEVLDRISTPLELKCLDCPWRHPETRKVCAQDRKKKEGEC